MQIINITIDIHRKLDKNVKSNYVCCAEEIRKINNDWTMSFKGKIYQLNKQSQFNLPTKSTVYVRKSIHGVVSIFYRNLPIEYTVVRWKSTRHFKFGGIMIF